ncbi:MAG: SusC/RagA family TonB-linked outer membrane protein [Prevotella sp.]|nr:SusC/RagA family TonB-linked outer membrane protein [Prevotella sp.]
MKSTIFNLLQTFGHRFAVSALILGLSTAAYAQSEDDEDEGEGQPAGIRQPDRSRLQQANYPTITLHGKVVEQATGNALAGIQLRALGYTRYTAMTEEDGTFTIKVPTFTTALYVHSPEFLPQQVAIVAGDSTQAIFVKMLSDKFSPMYGTGTEYTARRTAEIDRFGVTIDNEVAAKLGGDIRSIMRSAAADGGAAMFIRGLSSITSDAQPLVIIDGIEQDMQRNRISLHSGQFNNILANLSPDDVEKVTVLKNATALYGSRGANGVILIDTKRGKSMATRIDANISAGLQLVPKLPTMMNAAQYRAYAAEMLGTVPNINEYKNFYFLDDNPNGYYYHTYHNNTDWSDQVYRTALTQNYSVNVQGGDDVGMYNLSVGYVKAENTLKKSDFDRLNVRFNTDISILWNLSTKFDISIARTNNNVFDDGMPEDFSLAAVTSPTSLALIKSPLVSPFQYNAFVGGFTSLLSSYDDILASSEKPRMGALSNYSLANPLSILEYGKGDNKNRAENTYFTVRVAPEYKINNALTLSADVSYLLNRNAQRYYRPYEGVPPFSVDEMGTVTSKVLSMFAKQQNFVGRLQLDWTKQMGKHAVDAFVGGRYSYFSYDNSDLTTQYVGFTDDKNPALSASTSVFPNVDGVSDVWKNIQWYGNVDYNYMNRYFATVSLMAEANSRFGENADGLGLFGVKWAIFPSVQLGWVMTNEAWFPKHIGIDYLRLNAGYDISGNDNISNYAARTSFSALKYYNTAMGLQLTNIGNDKIQWETTKKLNLGLQAYLLNNRLGVSFDYYLHKTDNLLMLKSFSNPIGGINNYWSNGGSLENQGFEVMVTTKPVVTKNWSVELGASVGHYVNKVTKLPDGDFTSSAYGDNNILTAVGKPVALFYGYKTEGVFADDASARAAGNGNYLFMEDNAGQTYNFQAGDVHFSDLNHDGKIDAQDKTVIGDPNPDIYGNIFASATWKNLTLSVNMSYSLGNDVYNYQRYVLNPGSNFFNQQVAEINRWRYEGQHTDIPRLAYGDPMGNNRFSDRWIEDGSYLRMKALRLSYKVPVPGSWEWLQGLTIWAEAQNLFTLTKYLGSDPEFSVGNSVFYQGIDCGNLAQSRAFMAGLKINL